jgi:hypothetical protein
MINFSLFLLSLLSLPAFIMSVAVIFKIRQHLDTFLHTFHTLIIYLINFIQII